eukprot:TRINITY_DN104_c0_g1_i36.p1 TRINITY_DN104_c0_g1~~TRINITY_DN104_c0_g1_i36.p1  ORF type:complete len:384 (+),score=42.53 TRINITY_DN104_c0_g1_i36:117-1154(+)
MYNTPTPCFPSLKRCHDSISLSSKQPPTKRCRSSYTLFEETQKGTLDRFTKLEILGGGTFGTVWAALEKRTGIVFALKQIKITGNEGFPRTALREIKIMKKIHHDNVLSVREIVWIDKEYLDVYLVMDLYPYDLRKLLSKYRMQFSPSEVKFLFRQLIMGVKYLHDHAILHRDLKTENILLNACGNLKICDYGLSRNYSDRKAYTPVVATLWYRSPELLLGPIEYSTEVDMWSVGCIFAELILGVVLFNGTNELEQIDKIFQITGTPDEDSWPGFTSLPGLEGKKFRKYSSCLTTYFDKSGLSQNGLNLLRRLLTLDPAQRITSDHTDGFFTFLVIYPDHFCKCS